MFQLSPKTRKLLDFFIEADYGDEFSYAEILATTGCDLLGKDRQRIYTVVKILEREHKRSLANMRKRGYKVAFPHENIDLMQERKRRASHHLQLARRTGDSTNIAKLDENQTRELADELVHLSRVQQALAHRMEEHERRIKRIETEIGLKPEEAPIEGSAEEMTP